MPVIDRWYRRDKATGKKVRTARYGSGMRWEVQWKDEAQRRHSKSFATKDEAEANYASIKADLYRGAYIDPEEGRITLKEYAEKWVASRNHAATSRAGTRARLEKHIYPHLGHVPLRKIRASTIQAWLTTLANTESERQIREEGVPPRMLAGTTRERIFSTLATVLQAAVDDGILVRNPAKAGSVAKPKKDTKPAMPWTRERLVAVQEQLPDRWKPMIVLGIGLGLRRGEMMGLDPINDIDWLRGIVHVRRQVVMLPKNKMTFALPKYEKTRDVPLSDHVKNVLATYMQKYPPKPVTLPWKELDGTPVTANLLLTSRESKAGNAGHLQTNVWRPACRRAGFEPTNRDGPHVLRHTYASLLLDAGESIITVAARLGHADPAFTLKVYAHLMPDADPRTRSAVDAFLLGDDADGTDAASATGT